MASSESEGSNQPRNPRKRQRRATKDSEDPKKARGRPRVEAQDETAADRRRTQIRLAQRAYRQRKETTIASLQKQVANLETTIEKMNKSFSAFNEQAALTGMVAMYPELARQLETTKRQFLSLAQDASVELDNSEAEDQEEDQPAMPAPKRMKTCQPTATQHKGLDPKPQEPSALKDIGWGYVQNNESASTDSEESDSRNEFLPGVRVEDAPNLLRRFTDQTSSSYIPFLGLEMYQPVTTSSNTEAMDATTALNTADYDFQHFGQFSAFVPPPQAVSTKTQINDTTTLTLADGPFTRSPALPHSAASPPRVSPGLTSRIGAPYTYSFQETTFARRLHRATIERAFHLLSNAQWGARRFTEVFGLSLRFTSQMDARRRMKEILFRGTTDSLDNLGGPFRHIGGAGTHYPRKDAQGNMVPRTDYGSEKCIGPFGRLLALKAPGQQSTDADAAERIAVPDNEELPEWYRGEWLDVDDVQGYLEERGLKIEAQAHFADGEVTEIDEDALGPEIDRGTGSAALTVADWTMPYGMSPNNQLPSAGDSRAAKHSEDAAWNGTFHDLSAFEKTQAFDASNLFPETMALDIGGSLQVGEANDFASSAWFDDSSFVASASPGITVGSSAPEIAASGTPSVMLLGGVGPARKRTRVVTVDVSRMIEELIRGAVCLGRSPGFRRQKVDEALHAALISVH